MRLFISLLSIAVFAGCGGPSSNVQGTVTVDGQLARQGTVAFHPVEGGATAFLAFPASPHRIGAALRSGEQVVENTS